MTDKDVHEAVVRWLHAVTGIVTIKAYQGIDRPANPYMMVNMLNIREVREHHAGEEYKELTTLNSQGNNEIEVTPVVETEWEFSIHSYGDEPTAPLRALRSRARIEGCQQELDHPLSIFSFGTINHVPEKINKEWEERAHCLIQIRGYTRDGFLIDVIDQAPVNVTRK